MPQVSCPVLVGRDAELAALTRLIDSPRGGCALVLGRRASGSHGSCGLPATGRPFRISGAGVGEVRDGKITRFTEYWNMAEFLTQVGVLPPPQE